MEIALALEKNTHTHTQNVIMIFKVRCQGHRPKALRSL